MAKTDFSGQKGIFFRKNLQDMQKMCIFAIAKQDRAIRSRGGERRPSYTQGIFYVHTSETCQRSHYTNSGGHPVELYVLGRSLSCLATGRAAAFPVHRGDAPGREAGEPGGIKCVGRVRRLSPFLEEYSRRGNNIFPAREKDIPSMGTKNRTGRIPVC